MVEAKRDLTRREELVNFFDNAGHTNASDSLAEIFDYLAGMPSTTSLVLGDNKDCSLSFGTDSSSPGNAVMEIVVSVPRALSSGLVVETLDNTHFLPEAQGTIIARDRKKVAFLFQGDCPSWARLLELSIDGEQVLFTGVREAYDAAGLLIPNISQ